MASRLSSNDVLARLPNVRGAYECNAAISKFTWFRIGGPAEVLFEPADRDDLASFMSACPDDVPVTVIGVGSNLLVRDGGVDGVVVRLGKPFSGVAVVDGCINAGAGAQDVTVAARARDAGIAGLEFLCGVPGTVGGAVRMNAGAYGRELSDALVDADVILRDGTQRRFAGGELGFGYRHTALAEDAIVVSARLAGETADPGDIRLRMENIRANREESQPLRTRTGGSTFRNPEGDKAWRLIDAAGCRGLRRGAAMVSEKHCNFLINTGGATAADIEGLGEEVRRRVRACSGVLLEWEIRRIGTPAIGIEEIEP